MNRSTKIAAASAVLSVAAFTYTAHATQPKPIPPNVVAPAAVYLSNTDPAWPCTPNAYGCYAPTVDPTVIYLDAAITKYPAVEAYTIAHETAHFDQHRTGRPFDECEASDVAFAATGNVTMYLNSYPECDKGDVS